MGNADRKQRPARRLVSEREAAKYIGFSVSYLRQSRMNGNLRGRTPAPPYIRIGRSVRYDIADLDNWIDERRVI